MAMPEDMAATFIFSSAVVNKAEPPLSICVPSPRYCESEAGKGKIFQFEVSSKEASSVRPPVNAGVEEEVEGREGSRRDALSAVE